MKLKRNLIAILGAFALSCTGMVWATSLDNGGPALAKAPNLAPLTAALINFESDAVGPKPNGWQSSDSADAFFLDSLGADLVVNDYGSQSDGQSLAVLNDDQGFLIIDFAVPMRSVSLDFGNDDPFFSNPGDEAEIRAFLGGNPVGASQVVMNRNDIMDQTITFDAACFDQVEFQYNVTPTNSTDGLIELVDNIIFEVCETLKKELTSGPDRDGALWYEDFGDVSGLTLNGNAVQAGSALRLTAALQGQVGSAFTSNPVTLGPDGSFSTHFSFQITGSGGGGADGLAFVVHNAAAADTALGGAGGFLGYSGITPSLAVEFDTWNNGAGFGDPDANHVGTGINGVVGSGVAVPLGAPALDGGTVFYAWVDYDGVADLLEVRVSSANTPPLAPTLSQAGIGLAANLGGTSAYVGFTSGTGAAVGNHDILSWHFATTAAEYIDRVVPIGVLIPTEYDFTITWNGGDTPVWIYDRVPAEWDVTDIEFDNTGLPLDCGGETSFLGPYGEVEVYRGGKPGKTCQSDTGLRWMPGDDNTLNVQTKARCHDNKKNKKCKPTSCGALYLNYGAIAFEKDEFGDLVYDDNGDPVVAGGPTDPICLAAVDDVNGDGTFTWDGSGDEDSDGLADYEEACGVGTDPCNDDSDGDGIIDGLDSCPLEGPANPAVGEILGEDGCIRQSQCSDGIDNEPDGNIDFPADASCDSILDDSEDTPDFTIPQVCDSGTDGVQSGDPWVVCRADDNSAWISADTGGVYNAEIVCQALGYDTVTSFGGTCGNTCGWCQGTTSCENPGTEVYDGFGDSLGFPILTFTVNWLCVNNP